MYGYYFTNLLRTINFRNDFNVLSNKYALYERGVKTREFLITINCFFMTQYYIRSIFLIKFLANK